MTRELIDAVNISKHYRRGQNLISALDQVSFQIMPQESVTLLGKSGSGKTTLLNLLAGLDRATAGDLTVNDIRLTDCTKSRLDRYRQETVGIVFQQFRLIKHRTAAQNVDLPLCVAGLARSTRQKRVSECLDLVGLTDRAQHRPAELSGGEQQRVAIARAIANQPSILLADEPTGNLDSKNAHQVMELLKRIQTESSATLILITHDEELAGLYSDRILKLSDGRLVSDTFENSSADQVDRHPISREQDET